MPNRSGKATRFEPAYWKPSRATLYSGRCNGGGHGRPWLTVAANRLHHNVLATALANKLARIAWTVLVQARSYEARVN
jgi:hypothetical protein